MKNKLNLWTAAMGVFGIWICNKGMKKSANLLA